MIITNELSFLENSAVALGAFDGIHKAHRFLIETTISYAKENSIRSVVFTFSENPSKAERLTTDTERKSIFESLGTDVLFMQEFDDALKNTLPDEFLNKYLKKCRFVCVGFNFRFGKDRAGSTADIESFCRKNNIDYKIVDEIKDDGITVSSSVIRIYIKSGNFEAAEKLLGRPVTVEGTVVRGDRIGRKLGFPTINIEKSGSLIPKGVYATVTDIDGIEYKSVTNVGGKPTIRNNVDRIETHIIDFDCDIYGKEVKTRFVRKIRDIIKFEDVELLKKQLKKDIALCKNL